jgi:hypothetical protein
MATYKSIRRENGWYNQTEASRKLEVSASWFKRHRAHFPPSKRLGEFPCWSEADLAKARTVFDAQKAPATKIKEKLVGEGWYSIKAAAQATGVPVVSWRAAMERGRIPRPTHRVGAGLYYGRAEAERIAENYKRSVRPSGMLSVSQLARVLDLTESSLRMRLRDHPDLGVRSGRCRWFAPDQVEVVRARLFPPPPPGMSRRQVARMFGRSSWWAEKQFYLLGVVGTRRGSSIWYTPEEVEKLRERLGVRTPKTQVIKML